MEHPPIVQIKWVDSNQPVGKWRWLEDIEAEGVTCLSVGFLLQDTPEVKIIALSLGSNNGEKGDQAAGVQTIPTCAVLDIQVLVGVRIKQI
jgi:hypothetical protein